MIALPRALSFAALALLVAGASWTRGRADALRPPPAELDLDVPPFPAEVARPFSFGFRSELADVTFIEAVQVNGVRGASITAAAGAPQDRLLARLLTYATDLDPQFAGAYRFAGTALPRHTIDGKAMGVFAAAQILEKGTRERPDDWRISFLLGFIDSFYLGNMAEAARAMKRAARAPGSPAYVGLLATRLAADAGELGFAEQMAEEMVAQANEEATRATWSARLADLKMERILRKLEQAVSAFRASRGRPPASLDQLVAAGLVGPLPPEPHGGRWVIDAATGDVGSTGAARLRVRGRRGTTSGLEIR